MSLGQELWAVKIVITNEQAKITLSPNYVAITTMYISDFQL